MKSPSGLERVPRWTLRKFEIAEIGPEAEPDTRADRHNHDVVRYKRRHAEAADQICRAVHAAEPQLCEAARPAPKIKWPAPKATFTAPVRFLPQ